METAGGCVLQCDYRRMGEECPEGEIGTNVLRTTNFTNVGIIDFHKIAKRKIMENKILMKQLFLHDIIIENQAVAIIPLLVVL
jgi:hypothetical protein